MYWAPKKWTIGVRKVMRHVLFMSPRWKTWVWTLNVEHLVLGSDGNGNEAMVVTLRMPVSHEDVHDSLPSTSVRLHVVVFGNNVAQCNDLQKVENVTSMMVGQLSKRLVFAHVHSF